jgi:hypothetical protein
LEIIIIRGTCRPIAACKGRNQLPLTPSKTIASGSTPKGVVPPLRSGAKSEIGKNKQWLFRPGAEYKQVRAAIAESAEYQITLAPLRLLPVQRYAK